ncbi:hypothetical protein ES703_09611 [subsurface metagenome]
MRDPKRIKSLLKTIKKAWKKHPDLRLCQLIGNCFPGKSDLYSVEDDDLLKRIKKTYRR